VITALEVLPWSLEASEPLLDDLAEAQRGASGLLGQVLLQRTVRATNLELLSVWSSAESFEEYLASEISSRVRNPLAPLLVAPIEDRPHGVLCGAWTVA
jgi:quinol monooxygenase YgiN